MVQLATGGVANLWGDLPKDLTAQVSALLLQAAFAAPAYGGNPAGAGFTRSSTPPA